VANIALLHGARAGANAHKVRTAKVIHAGSIIAWQVQRAQGQGSSQNQRASNRPSEQASKARLQARAQTASGFHARRRHSRVSPLYSFARTRHHCSRCWRGSVFHAILACAKFSWAVSPAQDTIRTGIANNRDGVDTMTRDITRGRMSAAEKLSVASRKSWCNDAGRAPWGAGCRLCVRQSMSHQQVICSCWVQHTEFC